MSNRGIAIMMSSILGSVVLAVVAAVWIAVAREPERRAAYLARCHGQGFTEAQCRFLYAERRQREDDDALAATALLNSQAAMQRAYGR